MKDWDTVRLKDGHEGYFNGPPP